MNDDWKQDPRERFIAQFEWDGAQPLYREMRTGPAYRVTVEEYQGFIEDYDRRGRRRVPVAIAAVLIIFAIPLFVPAVSTAIENGLPKRLEWYALFGLALAFSWLMDRWLMRAPARALRLRTPESTALSGDERLGRTVGDRSWESLFGEVVGLGLLALWMIFMQTFFNSRPIGPAAWLFPALCLAAMTPSLTQMMRKWAFERRQRNGVSAAGI